MPFTYIVKASIALCINFGLRSSFGDGEAEPGSPILLLGRCSLYDKNVLVFDTSEQHAARFTLPPFILAMCAKDLRHSRQQVNRLARLADWI